MSAYDQSTKYASVGDDNNPYAILEYLKPGRILVNNVNPLSTTGELNDYYINSTTGDLFGPKTEEWGSAIYNFGSGGGGGGLTNIENNGTGVGLFKNIIGSTAHFKSLLGAINKIVLTNDPDEVRINISDSYKPLTLSLLNNFPLQTGLGSATFDPNGLLGVVQGYNQGSLFVQTGTPNKLWICQNPTLTQWSEYIPDAPEPLYKKDWGIWTGIGGTPQAILPGFAYGGLNLGGVNPTQHGGKVSGSKLGMFFDAGIPSVVILRSAETAERSYTVTLTLQNSEFGGPTTSSAHYDIRMIRDVGGYVYAQSLGGFTFPETTTANQTVWMSYTYSFNEPLLQQVKYRWEIRGVRSNGTPAQNFNINYFSISIQEI